MRNMATLDSNLPTGQRLGRILGQLDDISLRLEVMIQAQAQVDGETPGDLMVRLIQLQYSTKTARSRAEVAVTAANRTVAVAAINTKAATP